MNELTKIKEGLRQIGFAIVDLADKIELSDPNQNRCDKWILLTEAAEVMGVSRPTVLRRAENGEIIVSKRGKQNVYSLQSCKEYGEKYSRINRTTK